MPMPMNKLILAEACNKMHHWCALKEHKEKKELAMKLEDHLKRRQISIFQINNVYYSLYNSDLILINVYLLLDVYLLCVY